jgi:hypothetical protein
MFNKKSKDIEDRNLMFSIFEDNNLEHLLFTQKSVAKLLDIDEMETSKIISNTKIKLEELGIPLSQFFVKDESGKVLFNKAFVRMIVRIEVKNKIKEKVEHIEKDVDKFVEDLFRKY